MKIHVKLAFFLILWHEKNSHAQMTMPRELRQRLNMGKEFLLSVIMPTSKYYENLRLAEKLNKLQPKIDENAPFPCSLNNTRSKRRPQSVHKLKPGDIDVIAAIGDSLTAGSGLTATNILQLGVENRGMVFSIGGQGTWKEFLTLPNILKEFNSHLTGYSLGNAFGHQAEITRFNVAELAALTGDSLAMAKVLIKRMKNDTGVNIRKYWKMVFYMIGSNDVCSTSCFHKNPEDIVDQHRKDLINMLRFLRNNLPRTIVNLIVSPNVTALARTTVINKPSLCRLINQFECPCMFESAEELHNFQRFMFDWQQVEMEVANYAEFDREDFTVIAQPFASNLEPPVTREGLTDYSYFSEDCFHFSQKGGARAALSLWNNILEPVGNKTMQLSELYQFKCPTANRPFIFTRRNSLD